MKIVLIVYLVVAVLCINTMANQSKPGRLVVVIDKDEPKYLTDRDLVSL